jgi:hypothetical protein
MKTKTDDKEIRQSIFDASTYCDRNCKNCNQPGKCYTEETKTGEKK